MCRWIAYQGEPIFLEDVVSAPCHSLIEQSLHAAQTKAATNGDGFGLGWYGDRAVPGVYREVRPAWSDENLKSLCAQVRSPLFLAHVRASTGTATARANCHPFVHGRHMFVHNGQIGDYAAIRRPIENLIPDDLYDSRLGTTDSEAIFLAILARTRAVDTFAAVCETLGAISGLMLQAKSREAFRFTAAFTDGHDLHAFRWASDNEPPSLYYRRTERALIIVSEPLDNAHDCWREVPKGFALVARAGQPPVLRPIEAMALPPMEVAA